MTATVEQLYNHLKTLGKQWFYDKTEMDAGFVQVSATEGLLKNDGTVDTSTYLTSSDISGKVDSESLETVAISGSYLDLLNIPLTFPPTTHSHDADELVDNSAYTNLDTEANDTQDVINTAINDKIGALIDVDLIEVTDDKGTASADTMNKLYLEPETNPQTNDGYQIYVTVCTEDNGSHAYSWERLDAANLSGYAVSTHVHGNISNSGTVGLNSDYFVYTGTGGLVNSKVSIGNITTDGAIGNVSGKVAVTTTGGEVTVSDWITELDDLVSDLIAEGISQAEEQNNGD